MQRLKRKVGILRRRPPKSCGEVGCPWSGTNARFMESFDTQESLRKPHFSLKAIALQDITRMLHVNDDERGVSTNN